MDNNQASSSDLARTDDGVPVNAELAQLLCANVRKELVSYLSRTLGGNRALAEDMAQEALTRIVLAERQYSGQRARGLLYTIARNLLADHYRKEVSQAHALQTLGIIAPDLENRSPLRDLVAREDMDIVREAIKALPPRCRQVFVLSRFEHMSNAAIAQHCQISVSAVEKHMNRALTSLVRALDETASSQSTPV